MKYLLIRIQFLFIIFLMMATKKSELVLGYFNFRGKAQVPRLLCEYSEIPYTNKFYTAKEYMEEKKKNPEFSLPYLKKDGKTIQGPEMMSYFILTQFNKDQMMGKTEQDKVKIKMYCWSIESIASIIGTNSSKISDMKQMDKQWEKNIKAKLERYEKACSQKGEWFLGYLTIIDFSVYELVRYMDWMFPGKMKAFTNLFRIKMKMEMLPSIKAYQISPDSIKQVSPDNILKDLSALSNPQKNRKK